MNKKGEESTLDFGLRLLLVIVFFIFLAGCGYKYYTSQQCPVGYDLAPENSDPQISTFCGTVEEQSRADYRCCTRKTNTNEYCRYSLNSKQMILCKDLGSFNELYRNSRTCRDNTLCGLPNEANKCAGVYCADDNLGNNQICVIENVDGKLSGECKSEVILVDQTMGFLDDNRTQCGLRAGPQLFGSICNNEEIQRIHLLGLGNHCALEYNPLDNKQSSFLCKGTI